MRGCGIRCVGVGYLTAVVSIRCLCVFCKVYSANEDDACIANTHMLFICVYGSTRLSHMYNLLVLCYTDLHVNVPCTYARVSLLSDDSVFLAFN